MSFHSQTVVDDSGRFSFSPDTPCRVGATSSAGSKEEDRSRSCRLRNQGSMLHLPAHAVERARFPVIDIHTHLAFSLRRQRRSMSEERKFLAAPQELLEVMDRKNIRTMVNLTGAQAQALRKAFNDTTRRIPDVFSPLRSRYGAAAIRLSTRSSRRKKLRAQRKAGAQD